jgi:DNA-directed RNA polymerase sigma subunit (sigma70/sigma32)
MPEDIEQPDALHPNLTQSIELDFAQRPMAGMKKLLETLYEKEGEWVELNDILKKILNDPEEVSRTDRERIRRRLDRLDRLSQCFRLQYGWDVEKMAYNISVPGQGSLRVTAYKLTVDGEVTPRECALFEDLSKTPYSIAIATEETLKKIEETLKESVDITLERPVDFQIRIFHTLLITQVDIETANILLEICEASPVVGEAPKAISRKHLRTKHDISGPRFDEKFTQNLKKSLINRFPETGVGIISTHNGYLTPFFQRGELFPKAHPIRKIYKALNPTTTPERQTLIDNFTKKVIEFTSKYERPHRWTWLAMRQMIGLGATLTEEEKESILQQLPKKWKKALTKEHPYKHKLKPEVLNEIPSEGSGKKLLTKEEELELACKIQNGIILVKVRNEDLQGTRQAGIRSIEEVFITPEASAARWALLTKSGGGHQLAEIKAARRMRSAVVRQVTSLQDLVIIGKAAVERAALTFDPEKNCQFETFSKKWLEAHLTREIDARHQHGLTYKEILIFRRIKKVIDEAKAEGRSREELTVEEIAQQVGETPDMIEKVMSAPGISLNGTVHLDQDVSPEFEKGGSKMQELLGGADLEDSPETQFQKLESQELRRIISPEILGAIPSAIINIRFQTGRCTGYEKSNLASVNGNGEEKSNSIARYLGIPRESVDMIEAETLSRVRRLLKIGVEHTVTQLPTAERETLLRKKLKNLGVTDKHVEWLLMKRPIDPCKKQAMSRDEISDITETAGQTIDQAVHKIAIRIIAACNSENPEKAMLGHEAREAYEEAYGYDPLYVEKAFLKRQKSTEVSLSRA